MTTNVSRAEYEIEISLDSTLNYIITLTDKIDNDKELTRNYWDKPACFVTGKNGCIRLIQIKSNLGFIKLSKGTKQVGRRGAIFPFYNGCDVLTFGTERIISFRGNCQR